MKRILILAACWLIFGLAGLSAQDFSFSYAPDPQFISPGQSFGSTFREDASGLIHGYWCRILYDSTQLAFNSAQEGSAFAGQPIFWDRVETDTLNVIHLVFILTGNAHIMGPATLFTINFTHLTGDYNEIVIDWIKIYNPEGGNDPFSGDWVLPVLAGGPYSFAKFKGWLQGPWFQGAMLTGQNSSLPLTSPYPADPATVAAIPTDVVDWVLLELRATPTGQPFFSKSLWLGSDGWLRTPGKPYLILAGVPPGPGYPVLRHRNHLAVMGAAPFQIASAGQAPVFDFSLAANLYGTGFAEPAPGICALVAGDADQNGAVGPSDRNNHWRLQTGQSGYLSADFNLDAYVSPSDRNDFWRANTGRVTSVPLPR